MKTVKQFLDEKLSEANKRTEAAEMLRVAFVQDYPIEKISQLKLEEFILAPQNSGYANTFCRRIRYELEGLAHMGNVWPSTFGLYLKNGTQYELSDGLKKQFANDYEKAFVWIKEEIVCLLNSMKNDEYERIVESKLNSSFKYKLLIVYFPEKLIPVCTRSVLEKYCTCVGVETKSQEDSLYKNLKLKKAKDESTVFSKWTNSLFMQFCDWLMRNDKSIDISKLDNPVVVEKGEKSMKKYSVNEAVWLATALLAMEVYHEHGVLNEAYYYFKQADIVKRAQTLTNDKVDNARVSWWCCADAKQHVYNYLCSGVDYGEKTRRLASIDEFPEKTYPENLDMSDELEMLNKTITLGEVFKFVREDYPKIVRKNIVTRGWLLTWNPENWEWPEFEEWCEATKNGKRYTESWSCASRQPAIGDDVFLMKTGLQPRGIIAHGYVVKVSYEGLHYIPEKANAGEVIRRINVEFDRIQNIEKDDIIILQDDLKAKYPQQQWSPMASGIEIETTVLKVLKEEWRSLTQNTDDGFRPTMQEYNPNISKEEWKRYILEVEKKQHPSPTKMLLAMLELGGQATFKEISDCYGGTPAVYNGCTMNLGRRAKKYFDISGYVENDVEKWSLIPFQWKNADDEMRGYNIYRLRPELKAALMEIDFSGWSPYYEEEEDEVKDIGISKNTILYGPPGTGKTYSSAIYAVSICDEIPLDDVKKMDYSDVMDRYRELFNEDRIAFTTFHQSYGYEEFIEGIKPIVGESADEIGYRIEDGIFKKFCKTANLPNCENVNYASTVWKVTLKQPGDSDLKKSCFETGMIKFDWKTKNDCEGTQDFYLLRQFQEKMKIGDIVVSYYGNKTDIDGVGIVTGETNYDETKSDFRWSRSVNWIYYGEPINIHKLNHNKWFAGDPIYELKRVKVSELFALIKSEFIEADDKNYVFIIDEINRGNISKIFGELITLVEDTKRTGMKEEASAILPYSGETFSVPSNVYILGTMNTADRSIALMDTALRRRFEFVEMMPEVDVLRNIGADKVEDLDVALMLEKINERITYLYDREHTIGHAFFTKLAKEPTVDILKSIFEKSVIPLLQEYFYEDYQKIQMVLGDNGKSEDKYKFIVDSQLKVNDIFKGNVDEIIDLPEKKYIINKEAFKELQSYKEIL